MESRSGVATKEPVTLPVPFPIEKGVGTLFILGGASTPEIMVDEFHRVAGGRDARIVHIPSASDSWEQIENLREYYCEFYDPNPASFEFLHTYDRAKAETEEFAEPLRKATAVWIGGGDQARLARLFLGTPMLREIHNVFKRGGIISGTSSGATIQSDIMINRGREEMSLGQGFALYPLTTIDTHFTGRERQKRCPRVVLKHPDHIGIGIDEWTALVVNGHNLGVMGRVGQSVWYHFPDMTTRTVRRYRLGVGETVNLKVHVLQATPEVLEAGLRAIREPVVLTEEEVNIPDPD